MGQSANGADCLALKYVVLTSQLVIGYDEHRARVPTGQGGRLGFAPF
jgi:hypothetical protein